MSSFPKNALLGALLLLVAATLVINGIDGSNDSDGNIVVKTARGVFVLPKMIDFETFKREFGKHYTSRVEEMVRAKLFMARAFNALISAIKYKFGQSKFYLGVNQFSDLTPDERQKTLTSRPDSLIREPSDEKIEPMDMTEAKEKIKAVIESRPAPKPLDSDEAREVDDYGEDDDDQAIGGGLLDHVIALPGHVAMAAVNLVRGIPVPESDVLLHDYRSCIPEVKNQYQCGSCYIFAVTTIYEWLYCKAFGEKVEFSEQYAVDCGRRAGLGGCEGGFEWMVEEYYSEFGLELEKSYKYKGSDEKCPVSEDLYPRFMGRFKTAPLQLTPVQEMKEAIAKGPIVGVLAVKQDFQDYGGGVTKGNCVPLKNLHAVTIVGLGVQDGEEYWLIRNSYGTWWGERGYYKLSTKTECLHPDTMSPRALASNPNYKSYFIKNPMYIESLFGDRK